MSEEIAIRVDHLTKIYKLYDRPRDRFLETMGLTRKTLSKDHYALRDVSFQVRRGETIGIIGTNGSGKSTILKIITGVLSATSGEVSVDGRISALLELGAGFNPEYTGVENVYLNGTMIGFTKEEIDRKLENILSFADIGDFVYQPVKTYSSGMFVRLAFAVAINIDPEILIVDEALSVGDVYFQSKCYRKFEEFRSMGKTILFVSHDLSSISKYCDRVILLNQGTMLAQGDPKDMVDLYKKLLVGQLDLTTLKAVRPSSGQEGGSGGQTLEISEDDDNGIGVPDELEYRPSFAVNPDVNEYGDRKALILGFNILDDSGSSTNIIEKGKKCSILMKVHFFERVRTPIYAYTIADLKGTEITGSNTLFEQVNVPDKEEGEEQEISFTLPMDMQGGEYMLSLGCTGYEGTGFVVHHRLYDACSITVVSMKNTVGVYDANPEVKIK